MNFVYQAKVVGLNFHKVQTAVKQNDTVILVAVENEHDKDAIGVYNSNKELVGFIANSERTLSPNNRKNGNLSATELKGELDFSDREYYAEAVRVYSSCIYLEINEGNWSYINKPTDEVAEPTEIDSLKAEIDGLKAIVSDLQSQINSLKTLVSVVAEGDYSPSPSSSDRTYYSFVGLSHFDGQFNLDGELSIVEEPIFEGAKGTAVYLKSGEHRIGVIPSAKKKQYCEDHKIPYCSNKNLKGKVFGGDIRLEELVPDEYVVVSV